MRFAFLLATIFTVVAVPTGAADRGLQVTFTGKVTATPAKNGAKADESLCLVCEDGNTYTIVKDDGSRILFLDPGLHNRQVQLTARVQKGTNRLDVEKVQTLVKGQLHDLDYWCEACQFSNPTAGPCLCCGGETVFRERPAK